MTHEEFQQNQINELTQLMFELRNGKDDDFDGLLDLKDTLEQAVNEGDVSMVEVGNALNSAKSGNTALADEIRDRIDDRLQNLVLTQDLDEESVAYIDDDEYEVVQDDVEKPDPYLSVYVVLNDDVIDNLAEAARMSEKSGVHRDDLNINAYANIDENKNVELTVTFANGGSIELKNLPEEFKNDIIEKTEAMLENRGTSIQHEFDEALNEKADIGED